MSDITGKINDLDDSLAPSRSGHVLHTDRWQNDSQPPPLQDLSHFPIPTAAPLTQKKRKTWNPTRHHTPDHRNCPACEAVNERIMNIDLGLSNMTVPAAAEIWIEWKRPYVLPRTTEAHQTYINALHRFFAALLLKEVTPGNLREYQRAREGNADGRWQRKAGASAINHELNVLAQILEYAGLWKALEPYYHPVRMPRWTPRRVMTPQEEGRLFTVASCNPAYELAYLVASLTNNTTASGCELRLLQIKHVSLFSSPPEVLIPSDRVKNNDRGRRIPLNATARRQAEMCLQRAARLGAVNQDHYLFPFRSVRNTYDPTRPASRSWLRKQFEAMRVEAGLPWLRPHDLRHQAITRLLESGAPDQTVMAVAGHVSRRMMNHYSHIRMDAKMAAVNAIEPSCFQVAAMRQRL